MTTERSRYSCFRASKKYPLTPIFCALGREKYKKVRQMTGFDDQDIAELLYKLGKFVGDREIRQQHDIDDVNGLIIFAGKGCVQWISQKLTLLTIK